MENLLSYDIASFQACINMLKINTKQEIYKMILALLCDFQPGKLSKKMVVRYVNILLPDENKELACCLLSFLPDNDFTRSIETSSTISSTVVKKKKSKKSKHVAKAGQLLAQASAASKKPKVTSKLRSTSTYKHSDKLDNSDKTAKELLEKTKNHPLLQYKQQTTNKMSPLSTTHSPVILQKNKILPFTSPVTMKYTIGSSSSFTLNPAQKAACPLHENIPIVGTTDPLGKQKSMSRIGEQTSVPFIVGQRNSCMLPTNIHKSNFPLVRANLSLNNLRQINNVANVTPVYFHKIPSQSPRYFPNMTRVGEQTTAEDYLASHVNERKLTGPDFMSPFLKSGPTCIINHPPETESQVYKKKSPCGQKCVKSKSVHTVTTSKGPETVQNGLNSRLKTTASKDTEQIYSKKVRIQHPLQTTAVISEKIAGMPHAKTSQLIKTSRNLSTFPYIHQMTLPDGQTKHLRIQGINSTVTKTEDVPITAVRPRSHCVSQQPNYTDDHSDHHSKSIKRKFVESPLIL